MIKGKVQKSHAMTLTHHIEPSFIPPPEPSPLLDQATADEKMAHEAATMCWSKWKQTDSEVKFYIESGIPDSLLMKVINVTTAKDLWNLILSEHQSHSETFQAEMLRHLQNDRCSEVEDVRIHFAKMLQLRKELAATGKTVTEDHFTSILTNSLHLSVYGGVISTTSMSLKMHDKTPTAWQLVEAIEEEYMRCNFAQGGSMSTPTALYTSPQGQPTQKGKRKKKPN